MGRPALADRRPYDREQVVDAAVRAFVSRGYDATSMADVAAALGIHKSSLYHHVGGKEELLEIALGRALGALLAVLSERGAVEGPAVERLEHVVRRTVAIMVERLPEVTVLLRIRGTTPAETSALERRRAFDRAVEAIVAQAVDDGDVRSDVEPGLATRLVFGMSNSVTEWFQAGGRLRSEDLADAIATIALTGLRAPRRLSRSVRRP